MVGVVDVIRQASLLVRGRRGCVVSSSMDILKTSSWFFKEVIILYVYCLVIFTPYYYP